MANCVSTDENGFLYLSAQPIESCSQLVVLTAEDYNYLNAHTSITGADIVEYYSFGFALVFFGWMISFPIKAALKAINLV